MSIKRIGVLTSGGDAPGMNACVRAVVRTAMFHGVECYGIRRGYNGLIYGDMEELNARSVNGLTSKGGTTEKALAELENYKFYQAIISAMQECTKRADELSHK